MALTQGIRTWRRLSTRTDLPLEERIQETTDPAAFEAALRAADFITIPRVLYNPSGRRVRDGYDEAYAQRLARLLQDHYGFAGQVRTSHSGSSFVFERHPATGGTAFDFGLTVEDGPAVGLPTPFVRPSLGALPSILNGDVLA